MTKEQIFSDYLQRVADVLKLHSQALQELSKMSHLAHELEHHPNTKKVMEALQGRGEQMAEHAEYIQEVADNPQLLTMQ